MSGLGSILASTLGGEDDPFATSDKAEAYARQLKQLLPRGILWNLDPGSWTSWLLTAIADEMARVDDRGEDLINEWDPRTALETLEDWERVLGLPDKCVAVSTVVVERQAAVARQYVSRGGQTPAYYLELAAGLGFVATYDEPAAHTFRLTVNMVASSTSVVSTVFRAGASRAGDRLMSRSVAVLECVINRAKPAHAVALFLYV